MKIVSLFVILAFVGLSSAHRAFTFECLDNCICSRLFGYSEMNCYDNGVKTFHLKFLKISKEYVDHYGHKLILSCYNEEDFAKYVPVLKLPGITAIQYHKCLPYQTDVSTLEKTLFEGNGKLIHLYMSGYKTPRLTASDVEVFSDLRELVLFENGFSALDPDVLKPLNHLERFYLLSNHELNEIPPAFFTYRPTLKKIVFEAFHGSLSLPPRLFAHLPNLEYVQVEVGLEQVPENVFEGTSTLRTIHLNNNKITSLPPRIFASQSDLISLYLESNHLSTLDDSLFERLLNLVVLNLSHNKLTMITEKPFRNLHKLEALYLDHNKLTTLHTNILPAQSALRIFDVQYNELGALSAQILSQLPHLEELHAQNNPLGLFQFNWIEGKTNLTEVDLSNTLIVRVNLEELPVLRSPIETRPGRRGPPAPSKQVLITFGDKKLPHVTLPTSVSSALDSSNVLQYRVEFAYDGPICDEYRRGDARLKKFLELVVNGQKC